MKKVYLSSFFVFTLLIQFYLNASPIVIDDANWCSGSAILKRNLLLGVENGDKIDARFNLTVEPSSGDNPKPNILVETYEAISAPGENPSSVRTKVVVSGELGDRIMDHRGFFNEWFRGLFEETPLGGFNGTILQDVTVPVKNSNGEIIHQPLQSACEFQSLAPYLTEAKNPVSDEDKNYLRHFEWVSIIVSPEVPYGVVSFTYKSWKSDTINKPQTKVQSEFSLQSVSRLIPVQLKY